MAKSNDSTETTILDEVDDGEPILLDDSEVTEPETMEIQSDDEVEASLSDLGLSDEHVADIMAIAAAPDPEPNESFGQWVTIESATLVRGERDRFTITHPQPGAHGLWYLNENGKEGFVAWSCGVQLVDVKRSIEPNLFG